MGEKQKMKNAVILEIVREYESQKAKKYSVKSCAIIVL